MLRERGIRVDLALAAALTVIGVATTLDPDARDGAMVGTLLIPAVTLPVIWRRREPLAASVAFGVGVVVSGIPTFDQTRCGVAIPAALLIVFSLGARAEQGRALAGLAVVLAGLGVLVFTDPLLDGGGAFFLPIAAGVWAAGRFARSRMRVAAGLAQRMHEIEQTREAAAALAVDIERARLASTLDVAVRERIRSLVDRAAAAERDPGGSVAAFHVIETEGRACLNAVRELLGVLRSDSQDTSPRPTLAQLETLLRPTEHGRGLVALGVEGRRRALPAGVELAAYRMIELALEAFAAGGGDGPADVMLRYRGTSLELEVHGSLPDGVSVGALAAARERVTAHGGSFDTVREGAGRLLVRARLPFATSDA
jgi:hypothetical protein